MSRTQLSYLDLAAFYQAAKSYRAVSREQMSGWRSIDIKDVTHRLCENLMCVIDAIRSDGLDPRWHPEVDALRGLAAGGVGGGDSKWAVVIDDKGAEGLVYQLHQRGYKIVKDGA